MMIHLIFALCWGVLAGIFLIGYKIFNKSNEDSDGACFLAALSFIFFVLAVGAIIIGTLNSAGSIGCQRKDFEEIERLENCATIYEDKAEALTGEFKIYLATMYPELEKGIFERIGPGDVNLYFAKYPELKSSETMLALVAQINRLQNDVYQQKIDREKVLKEIRYRQVSPWIFNSWIPKTKG